MPGPPPRLHGAESGGGGIPGTCPVSGGTKSRPHPGEGPRCPAPALPPSWRGWGTAEGPHEPQEAPGVREGVREPLCLPPCYGLGTSFGWGARPPVPPPPPPHTHPGLAPGPRHPGRGGAPAGAIKAPRPEHLPPCHRCHHRCHHHRCYRHGLRPCAWLPARLQPAAAPRVPRAGGAAAGHGHLRAGRRAPPRQKVPRGPGRRRRRRGAAGAAREPPLRRCHHGAQQPPGGRLGDREAALAGAAGARQPLRARHQRHPWQLPAPGERQRLRGVPAPAAPGAGHLGHCGRGRAAPGRQHPGGPRDVPPGRDAGDVPPCHDAGDVPHPHDAGCAADHPLLTGPPADDGAATNLPPTCPLRGHHPRGAHIQENHRGEGLHPARLQEVPYQPAGRQGRGRAVAPEPPSRRGLRSAEQPPGRPVGLRGARAAPQPAAARPLLRPLHPLREPPLQGVRRGAAALRLRAPRGPRPPRRHARGGGRRRPLLRALLRPARYSPWGTGRPTAGPRLLLTPIKVLSHPHFLHPALSPWSCSLCP